MTVQGFSSGTVSPAGAGPGPVVGADLDALAHIARLANDMTGLYLPPQKYPMLRARLGKRLRQLHLPDLMRYWRLLDGPDGRAERHQLIGLLTTHVSQFFREPHHLDRLKHQILPQLLKAASGGGRLRLWSAGCAAGQEAFSLAMVILDLLPDAFHHDIRILATDIDAAILARAESRFFPTEAAAAIPAPYRARFVQDRGHGVELAKDLARLVRFRCHNLHAPWQVRAQFDVIMCRNVLIYFDQSTCDTVVDRFARSLAPGGHPMLGHSERLSGPAAFRLCPDGIATWRRPAADAEIR
jgi:chemotaxis protein methyltransferase CheR